MPEARCEPTPGGMRILLVHQGHEPELTRILAREGHDVLAVADDARPARFLAIFKPDVVLVVARDGAEICRDLRRYASDISIAAIVAVVASDDADDRVAALDAGADDCLSRSCHREELMARMRAARRRRLRLAETSRLADKQTLEGAA